MNRVTINGNTITSSGSITVTNGKIFIDGKDVTPDAKEINIEVVGNVDTLRVDACNKISIKGDVGNCSTQSGDVDVTGDIKDNVSTMSGDVDASSIGGSTSTMSGDIKTRR